MAQMFERECEQLRGQSHEGPVSNITLFSQEELDSAYLDYCYDTLTVGGVSRNLTFPPLMVKEVALASQDITALDLTKVNIFLLNVTDSLNLEKVVLRDIAPENEENYISVALRSDVYSSVQVEGAIGINLLQLEGSYIHSEDAYSIEQLMTKNSACFMYNVTTITQLNASKLYRDGFHFPALESLGSVFLQGIARFDLGLPSVDIKGKFHLEYTSPEAAVEDDASFNSSVPADNELTGVDKIRTIGDSLTLSGLVTTIIEFKSLTSVGGDMTIYNNTNCTFSFPWLRTVKSLVMSDNKEIALPGSGLEMLKTADSIHLNGYIDTTSDSDIFPNLDSVGKSMVIEAWNEDFNCSKLVSMWQKGIIANLSCNGTDNEALADASTAPSGSASDSEVEITSGNNLAPGQWAGIGVAIAVVVLGMAGALVWVVRYYRRKLKALSERTKEPELPQGPEFKPHLDGNQIHETGGIEVVGEMETTTALNDRHLVQSWELEAPREPPELP